jgi:PAS domain S-box-containing protein
LIKKKENNEAENGATPVRHYLLTDRGYRQLIDNFPAFILGIELDGTISIFNKFAQTATGYTEDEIIGKKINDILQLEDPSFDTQPINLPPQGIEAPLLSANKSIRYIKWYFIPILSRHAELLGWGAFGSDVTEEKKRIEEIKYLASMSRRVIDAIPHSILLLDNELNIVDANRYHIEKVGEAQIWGKNIKELFPSKLLEKSGLLEALNNCLINHVPANFMEVPLSNGEDNGKWVNIRVYPLQQIPDEKLSSIILVIEDVTNYVRMRDKLHATNQSLMNANQELQNTMEKLREAQFEIIKSEKMATIGQLAAGMAHEINNPLGYLLSNITAVSNYMVDIKKAVNELRSLIINSGNEELISKLKEIDEEENLDFIFEDTKAVIEENIDGLLRIKGIIKDLNTFSLAQMGQYEWIDVNKLIDATLQMVYNTIKHKAVLKKHYGELPRIYADPSKLGQVLLSVITHAAQANEEGNASNNLIEITTQYGEGNNIYVSVRDTGCGIPEENLTKIFDPFYTTKPVGEGTGMGLAVSLSI